MIRLLAQNDSEEIPAKTRVKMSGEVAFMSSTTSPASGGLFSQTPGIGGIVTASKSGFMFLAGRISDLIDPNSRANLTILMASHTQAFGKFSATVAAESYLTDKFIEMDLIGPSLALSLKGAVNLDLYCIYGYAFQGDYDNLFTQRAAISKDYAGFMFKITGWNVYLGTHRQSLAFEVSTKLSERIRFFVSGNLIHNYDTDITQKFGVVRLAYLF